MDGTKGHNRVRSGFNPGNLDLVGRIKGQTAALIDICEDLGKSPAVDYPDDSEVRRLVALAQTAYEEAAMWAVKAATAE